MKITLKNEILIVNFEGKKDKMNEVLDPISNQYEGLLLNREGHNFPADYIPSSGHCLSSYKTRCKYVIGIYNIKSLNHELQHAKYYLDADYRTQVQQEWSSLEPRVRDHITTFLTRLGYSQKVLLDEYQAYKATEPRNFFGVLIQ
jgi:hypothetical protein